MLSRGMGGAPDQAAELKCKDCGEVCYTLQPGERPAQRGRQVEGSVIARTASCKCGQRNIMIARDEQAGAGRIE